MLQGATPLHYAAFSGISANLQMLLEYGAAMQSAIGYVTQTGSATKLSRLYELHIPG